MDDPLWLPGRARGVQDVQHVLGVHRRRLAVRVGMLHQPVVPLIARRMAEWRVLAARGASPPPRRLLRPGGGLPGALRPPPLPPRRAPPGTPRSPGPPPPPPPPRS